MKALGLGVLTGAGVATVAAALVFALTDRGVPLSDTKASVVAITPEAAGKATPDAGGTDTSRAVAFAGRVAGSGGQIALSVRQGEAVGYFCDGKREIWLSGDVRNNRVTLVGTKDPKALLTADLGKGGAAGNLILGEQAFTFAAPRLAQGRTVQIGGVTLGPEYVDAFMEERGNG